MEQYGVFQIFGYRSQATTNLVGECQSPLSRGNKTGFMENISDGGIFVATYASFEIGERLELLFSLPGVEGWCTTVCEVR